MLCNGCAVLVRPAVAHTGEDCAYLTLEEIKCLMSGTVVDLPHCTGDTCPAALSRKGRKGREEKAR